MARYLCPIVVLLAESQVQAGRSRRSTRLGGSAAPGYRCTPGPFEARSVPRGRRGGPATGSEARGRADRCWTNMRRVRRTGFEYQRHTGITLPGGRMWLHGPGRTGREGVTVWRKDRRGPDPGRTGVTNRFARLLASDPKTRAVRTPTGLPRGRGPGTIHGPRFVGGFEVGPARRGTRASRVPGTRTGGRFRPYGRRTSTQTIRWSDATSARRAPSGSSSAAGQNTPPPTISRLLLGRT